VLILLTSWWNKKINNQIRAENLVKWLTESKYELLNEPDVSTFYRKGLQNNSVIDLVFYTQNIKNNNNILTWEINPAIASGSDYEILLYLYKNTENMVLNPKIDLLYNFDKADWKLFSESIINLDKQYDLSDLNSEEELEKEALIL